MGFALREGLSFCRIDDRFVFLDRPADSYFCLPPAAERAFRALLEGAADGAPLAGLGIGDFVEGGGAPRPCTARMPTTCFTEGASVAGATIPYPTRLSVRAHLLWTKWQVRRRPLDLLLGRLASAKRGLEPSARDRERANPIIAAFQDAGRYTAADGDCLPRALSLAAFLIAADICPTMTFGVRLDPFAAHCWVQIGPLLADGPLESVLSYTPILAI